MADYTKVYHRIHNDPDFRECGPDAQWLYFLLMTHPKRSSCGVLPWSPRGLASRAKGMTPERVILAAWELGQQRLIAVDTDTDEVLVRSFVRHDGILRVPNQAKKMAREYGGIDSMKLMRLVSIEVRRGIDEDSSEAGAVAAESVAKQFKEPLPEGFEMVPEWFQFGYDNPNAEGNGNPSPYPSANPNAKGKRTPLPLPLPPPLPEGKPSSSVAPETQSTKAMDDDDKPKMKETRLPKSWAPTAEHVIKAKELGLNLTEQVEAFRSHAETHDRHAARWNAAFTTWLKKAPRMTRTNVAPIHAEVKRLEYGTPEWEAKYGTH